MAFEEQDNPNPDYDLDIEPAAQIPGYDFVSGWGRLNVFMQPAF
ncbi:hypothetical protein PO124_20505 [Bacillus licheniformis]|nr:hypothetical protein [Bacillus licheniformis]